MSRLSSRSLLAAAGAGLAAVCAAAPAQAVLYAPIGDECSLVRTPVSAPNGLALTDPLGYTIGMGPTASGGYATLWDGGSSALTADGWNGAAQLFVGAGESGTTLYSDTSAHGCSRSASGRQIDFAPTTVGGLTVQRSMLVPGADGVGVRILDAVRNPTSAPITTSVWVGDLRDGHGDAGLGSDSSTTIRATSSGDATVDDDDLWAVTTDTSTFLSDPALVHVWGGRDAATPASLVRFGAQPGTRPVDAPSGSLSPKQLGWAWQNVTIAPGETARFMSWEISRESASHAWSDQAPLAEQAADDLMDAPLSTLYQGLSAAQIATIRNWAPPAVDGGIAAVPGASAATATNLHAVGIDYGASELSSCGTGTLTWDFGDGGRDTGTLVSHHFAAGTAHVTLTIEGACGGSTTRSLTFAVAPAPSPTPTPAATATPTPTPTPAPDDSRLAADRAAPAAAPTPAPIVPTGPTLKLFGPPSVKTTTLASSHGLIVGVQASVDGTARLVLTGTGVKSVKTATLKAGVTSLVKVQLDPSARTAALALKTIRLRAKLTPVSGGDVVTDLQLKLRR